MLFSPAKIYNTASLEEGRHWISGAGWIYEEKKDGVRAILSFGELIGRTGTKIKCENVPEALLGCVLDGELCGGFYWVFDLLCINGEDVRSKQLIERKTLLLELSQHFPAWICLIPCGSGGGELLEAVLANGGEGVVAKPLNTKYGVGWVKCKREETHDCVVVRKDSSKRSLSIVQYKNGSVVDCGNVASLSDQNWNSVRVGDVVEVKCHSRHKSGKFREPRLLRLRTDKPAKECVC